MNFYDYEFINTYAGTRSPTGKVEYDYSTAYFMRSLYQRAMSVINFNLPDGWNKQYFVNVLFRNGFIGIIPTDRYGIIPQICTLSGYGLYLQPTDILVNQPLVEFKGTIGESCELIKLTPDYRGITDIIEHYARQLSTALTSLNMSLENSRLSILMGARNKSEAETLKIIAEKISSGETVIVYDKSLNTDSIESDEPFWKMSYNVKDNYITDKLLSDMATILANFDREIGIPVVDEKKERMITGEVSALTSDSCARLNTWIQCLDETIKNTNDLFDLNISYTTKLDEVKEVQENESYSENNSDRDL